MAQAASALGLETLLIALTAGLWVENTDSARATPLMRSIAQISMPVYALFFAAAGAKVNLQALSTMWPLALLLSATRALAIWLGAALGCRVAKVEDVIARYAWFGLISQAGVTLALVAILQSTFPEWGDALQVLIVAMIALHEIVGPIGFQYALGKAGEVGKGQRH